MASLGAFAGGLGGSLQAGFAAREREKAQRGQLREQEKSREARSQRDRLTDARKQITDLGIGIDQGFENLEAIITSGKATPSMIANAEKVLTQSFQVRQSFALKIGDQPPESSAAFQLRLAAARTALTPTETAKQEGEAAVTGATSQAQALTAAQDQLTPEQGAIAQRILGLGDQAQTEFARLVDEIEGLQQTNQLIGENGQPSLRATALLGRMNALMAEDVAQGNTVTTFDFKDGQIQATGLQQPAARLTLEGFVNPLHFATANQNLTPEQGKQLFASLTGPQQAEMMSEFNRLTNSANTGISILQEIQTNPSAFGLVGTGRRAVQSVFAILESLTDLAPDSVFGKTVVSMAEATKRVAQSLDPEGAVDLERQGFFDPKLPELMVLENAMSMDLAKTRMAKGDADTRALGQFFKAAKKDVNLTGRTSPKDVEARILAVVREIDLERRGLGMIALGEDPGPITQSLGFTGVGTDQPELSDDDLDKRVLEILGN